MQLTLTTNPGLEECVREEWHELLLTAGLAERDRDPPGITLQGRVPVVVDADASELHPLAVRLRSVHHVIRDIAAFDLPDTDPLTAIRSRLAGIDLPGLDADTPFRVTSMRSGVHAFTSMDVQIAAGAGIQDRSGAPVSLRNHAMHVEVDVIDERVLVGVRWSEHALSRRFARPYQRRVALAANVAHAMLRLAAREHEPRALLDPCCGTGTILLEAGHMFPQARLVGSDSDPRSVTGAAENLTHYDLAARSATFQADCRALSGMAAEGPFDAIATNPPFGRRLGQRIDFRRFYRELLDGARTLITAEGRLVLLADRRGLFNSAVRDSGRWHIRDVRIIELGGIHPGLYVLEPT